MHMLKNLP